MDLGTRKISPHGAAMHCEAKHTHTHGDGLHFFLCCLFPTLGALLSASQAASLLYRSEPLSTGTQQDARKGKVNERMALSMVALSSEIATCLSSATQNCMTLN